MWVDDPTGELASKNPKARTRVTMSGKPQVLIFRRAAKLGQRKAVRTKIANGLYHQTSVPMSYPGAPGRIGTRQAGQPWTPRAGPAARSPQATSGSAGATPGWPRASS